MLRTNFTTGRWMIWIVWLVGVWVAAAPVAGAGHASDDDDDHQPLSAYFGFDELEVIRIGRHAGPIVAADMNGNGLNDLVVVNNHASRIEIHYQKQNAAPDDPVSPPSRVNEFPDHWRYERVNISVAHHVTSIIVHDFDGDGRPDIIYLGQPSEMIFLRQVAHDEFRVARRHRVRNLSTHREAMAIANVLEGDSPEVIALAGGEIHIWPMDGDVLGQPVRLSAGANMVAFAIDDFNGDGVLDIAGVIPDDAAPVRIWFGDPETGSLGAQTRYEMPPIRAFRAVQLPGHDAARIAVIEQQSRRLMIYELVDESLIDAGTREAAYHVHSYTDPGNRKRHTVIADVTGNGLPDVITTDTRANAVVLYRQIEGRGLLPAESHPSLADIDRLAVDRAPDGRVSLFVLSESEGVVGRSEITSLGISFPQPLTIADGHTPVTMALFDRSGVRHLAVVSKSGRDHIVEILDLIGGRETIELGGLVRSPETILPFDADQNGRVDLLLFTRDRPMVMLKDGDDGFEKLESDAMGQYGLVQNARAENTTLVDIDGNGRKELLIADRNYIRAMRYDPSPAEGISPGWQVVTQINANDSSSQLVSLAVMPMGVEAEMPRIIAADRAGDRLIVMESDIGLTTDGGSRPPLAWREAESLHVRGFSFDSIHAGAFSGDDRPNILAFGNDGFAVIKLAGERLALRETAAWRSSEQSQFHHHLAVGDVNNDGFTDLIALDSGEQMCDIFTFTQRGRLLHAMSFKVFETRIFTGGAAREYQPTQAVIADVTGNGLSDLVFTAHDRVLIYPQTAVE
jgi:hypothetical protein